MAAALKTMEMLERDDCAVYKRRAEIQERLQTGIQEAASAAGHDLLILGMPGNFCTHFTAETDLWTPKDITAASDMEKSIRFRRLLREEGIIQGLGNRWFVSFALNEKDVDEAVSRAKRAFQNL
mgnify:CR=1 FL=1